MRLGLSFFALLEDMKDNGRYNDESDLCRELQGFY